MPPVKGLRHTAREYVLRTLYSIDLMTAAGEDHLSPFVPNWQQDDRLSILPEADRFAQQIVSSVIRHQDEIDTSIIEHSKNWRLERMTTIDRNILRMSICELIYFPDTPTQVILNEAIELAKCYGDENSAKFINGILDPLAREIRNIPSRRHE